MLGPSTVGGTEWGTEWGSVVGGVGLSSIRLPLLDGICIVGETLGLPGPTVGEWAKVGFGPEGPAGLG